MSYLRIILYAYWLFVRTAAGLSSIFVNDDKKLCEKNFGGTGFEICLP
jgi:hypothetical protein